MSKRFIISWCIVFVLFFIVPQVTYPFLRETESVNTENRTMAEFPEVSFSTIKTFPKGFEAYYNDALPFRSQLISANTDINFYCFKESSVPEVIIGKDNWLFYHPDGQDGDSIADLQGNNFLSNEELKTMLEHLLYVEEVFARQGREFVVMIAPNKESIYGERYLPSMYQSKTNVTTADQVVAYLRENSNLRIVYPKEELLNAIEQYPQYDFYYNTDTHWNKLGAYIGAKALITELGGSMEEISPQNIEYDGPLLQEFDLSMMLKMGDKLYEENSYFVNVDSDVEILSSSMDFYTEYRFTTNAENPQKLFMVRDSFCTAMAEYVAYNYAESVMIHRYEYTPEMVLEENPDIVVYEIVERHIRLLSTLGAIESEM